MILVVLVGVIVPDELSELESAAFAMLGLQLVHSLPATRGIRRRWGWWTLALQVALLPLGGPAAFPAGSVLLMAPRRLRWPAFGVVVAAAGVPHAGQGVGVWANAMGNALSVGLLVFALTKLSDLYAELETNRNELAARSVIEVRDRMSRALELAVGTALSEIIRLAAENRPQEIVRRTVEARAAVRRPLREAPAPLPPPGDLTPRHALPILISAALWYPIIATISVLNGHPSSVQALVSVADIVLVVVLHTYHMLPRPTDTVPRYWAWTLPALLLLSAAPLFMPGRAYPELLVYAGGSIPVVLNGRRACWPVFATYVALIPAVLAIRDAAPADIVLQTLQGATVPWMFFALALFTRLVYQVRETRLSLAMLAVAQERRRIDRDIHDLLGSQLWAIMVKAELAAKRPERASAELADLAGTARRALADLRAIPADGDIALSSAAELDSAREILTSAGIDVQTTWNPGTLAGPADALLAIVLREGATNVLGHSRARHCEIVATRTGAQLRLCMTNDGVLPRSTDSPGQGTGNLTARAQALGGTLTAESACDGSYKLVVSLPADPDQ